MIPKTSTSTPTMIPARRIAVRRLGISVATAASLDVASPPDPLPPASGSADDDVLGAASTASRAASSIAPPSAAPEPLSGPIATSCPPGYPDRRQSNGFGRGRRYLRRLRYGRHAS